MKRKLFLESELKSVQAQYYDLVKRGFSTLDINYFSPQKCLWFVDEVTGFWLDRKQLLNYCWDRLTQKFDCFILSAAIGLDVAGGGQYRFKAVGDYQLLHDPFIKLERLLRAPANVVNSDDIESRFRSVMQDTMSILDNHLYDFFFIDLSVLGVTSETEKIKSFQQGYQNFLKQLFEEDDFDSISEKYPTYFSVEQHLPSGTLDLLLFNNLNDQNLSLGERVDKFLQSQRSLANTSSIGNECDKFLFVLFCLYSQATDTILSCLSAGVLPYYRSEVPIRYFYLLMRGYKGDEMMMVFIRKSIAAYILGSGVEQLGVEKVPYINYRKYLYKNNPYGKMINSLQTIQDKKIGDDPRHISKIVNPIIDKIKLDLNL